MGGHSHDMPYTWRLSWLAIEKPWSALAGPFLSFLTQTDVEKAPQLCRGSTSGTVDSFQFGEVFTCQRPQIIVSSLMSGGGRGHEPQET